MCSPSPCVQCKLCLIENCGHQICFDQLKANNERTVEPTLSVSPAKEPPLTRPARRRLMAQQKKRQVKQIVRFEDEGSQRSRRRPRSPPQEVSSLAAIKSIIPSSRNHSIKTCPSLLWHISIFSPVVPDSMSTVPALVDTCADINAISSALACQLQLDVIPREQLRPTVTLRAVAGSDVAIRGVLAQPLRFRAPGMSGEIVDFTIENCSVLDHCIHPVILGQPFLGSADMWVSVQRRTLRVDHGNDPSVSVQLASLLSSPADNASGPSLASISPGTTDIQPWWSPSVAATSVTLGPCENYFVPLWHCPRYSLLDGEEFCFEPRADLEHDTGLAITGGLVDKSFPRILITNTNTYPVDINLMDPLGFVYPLNASAIRYNSVSPLHPAVPTSLGPQFLGPPSAVNVGSAEALASLPHHIGLSASTTPVFSARLVLRAFPHPYVRISLQRVLASRISAPHYRCRKQRLCGPTNGDLSPFSSDPSPLSRTRPPHTLSPHQAPPRCSLSFPLTYPLVRPYLRP